MKRFIYIKQQHNVIKHVLSIAVFLLVLILFIQGVSSVSKSTVSRQHTTLENAVNRCIMDCYISEGAYPESLEYLKSHYGLMYNEELFYIDYQAVGSNIMPDVTIIEKEN